MVLAAWLAFAGVSAADQLPSPAPFPNPPARSTIAPGLPLYSDLSDTPDPDLEALDDLALAPLPSPWFHEVRVRTAAGYNDNVALANIAPVASPFISTGLEGFLSRLPLNGTSLDLFCILDDIRYFKDDPVDKEQLAYVQFQVKQRVADCWQPSLALEYFYQDQVLDVSITEADLNVVQVQGHSLTLRPGLRFDLLPHAWMAVELPVNRQLFSQPLDDYHAIGPLLSLGHSYGHQSQLTASYQSTLRSYDSDPLVDAEGETVPGTRRVFEEQEIKLALRHYWEPKRHWRSTFKLGYKTNRDNGDGYFDYNRLGGGHVFLYRTDRWDLQAEATLNSYRYLVQRTDDSASPQRHRFEVLVSLRAERQLTPFLRTFAQYEFENTDSNDSFEEYSVNKVTAGLLWVF